MNAIKLLILLLLAPTLAHAEWPSLSQPPNIARTGANDVALLIGIENYAFLPDVPGARSNVQDWQSFLTQGLGVKTLTVLSDAQATREEVLEQARILSAQTSSQSTFWLVFVGHGAPDATGDGNLLGADAQQNIRSVESRGIKRSELINAIESGIQLRTVAILDTCFSGRSRTGEHLLPGAQPVVPLNALANLKASTLLFTAARADQIAGQLPGTERPAFSYLMLGGLRGWADDGDGVVTAREVHQFATNRLISLPGRTQTPEFWGPGGSELVQGVSEAFPQPRKSPVAANARSNESEASITLEAPVHPSRNSGDSFDSHFFGSLYGGVAGDLKYERASPWVGAKVGLKFADLGSSILRGSIQASWNTARNPTADEMQAALNQIASETNSPYWTVEDGHEYHRVALSMGPGMSWRWKIGPNWWDDLVLGVDLVGGANIAPLGRCARWEGSSENLTATCDQYESVPIVFTTGLRAGAHWKFMEIGFFADLAPAADEFFGGITIGASLDP